MTAPLPEVALQILSQEFEVIVADPSSARDEDELIELLTDADGAITLLTDRVTRRVLAANPNLRVIGNYAVGVNNIDLVAARELGVVITNTPGVLTDATADLTLALILATTRRIVEADRFVREGRFTGFEPTLLLGPGLPGKTLGIIGMGRIGFATAMRCRVLGMNVVYYSRSGHPEADTLLDARRVTLDELLELSDVVSLHVPLTPETRHIMNVESLQRMKRGAWLINTSRGPLIDEGALADALESGHLAGAGLDVYENEPQVERRLLQLPNVVLVPHIGSATSETRDAMARAVAGDVAAVLRGGAPQNRVA